MCAAPARLPGQEPLVGRGLLTTKLRMPPLRPGRIPRPRLLDRVQIGLDRPLILISAPAGFGKTTLAVQSLAEHPVPVAWVALDEGDNDLAQFWCHVAAAIQTVIPGLADAALGLAQSGQPLSPLAVPSVLLNTAATLTQDLVIALDDYHVIHSEAVHQGVGHLLEHLPPGLRLLLLTRSDPPFPLARLRARDQLTEIRAADLRFTAEEAMSFLNGTMRLALAAGDVQALATRTEGWIAGLQLAALALRDRDDAGGFIAGFAGTHHFVLDYLVEEVLRRQSPEVQTFLQRTAILDRMTGPLCDALTGQSGGQETLRQLEKANLFLAPMDDEHLWFRYHQLFADVLRSRLQQTAPERVPELHGLASAWFEASGLPGEAVQHALSAGAGERAAALLEQHAWQMLNHGHVAMLLKWLEAVPAKARAERPWLLAAHAWALISTGQVTAAAPMLQAIAAAAAARAEDGPQLRGHLAALQAYAALLSHDAARTADLAQQALSQLVEDQFATRSITTWLLGRAYLQQGDLKQAADALAAAAQMSREAGNFYVFTAAVVGAAELRLAQGRLRAAAEILAAAARTAAERQPPALTTLGAAQAGLADIAVERGDLAAAARELAAGLGNIRTGGDTADMVNGLLVQVRLCLARGDTAGAQAAIAEAQQWQSGCDSSVELCNHVAAWQARVWLAAGKVNAAAEWTGSRPADDGQGFLRCPERLVRARVAVATGRADAAARDLETMADTAAAAGRWGLVIHAGTLQALALHALGRTVEALGVLTRTLALAEPEGYMGVFIAEGAPMAALLRAAQRQLAEAKQPGLCDYVERLLHALPSSAAAPPDGPVTARPAHRPGPVQALTERELEVLRLLAAGLTNDQIGRRLFISVPTVKRHISNLYGKLAVTHRTQALNRARELNLL